jgi:glycosyltransferase involved in cell wall biosynthesis
VIAGEAPTARGGDVTVVVTTFERPDYLAECLASIERQTLSGFRVVVLDNASEADYSGVIERFRSLSVSYVRNETNRGSVGNIEKALREHAHSPYVVVFHDDDLMHPRMLESELAVLEGDPTIQFVATELAAFDDGQPPPETPIDLDLPVEIYATETDLARSLLGAGGLCFPSTMYRSSVLPRIEFHQERFSVICDRPFLLDAARFGKTALIRAPLVSYRHHPGQDTHTGSLTAEHLIALMKRYRAALPRKWSRADQELFYAHARYFLAEYGYTRRLAPDERIGAIAFVRKCLRNGVLRFRDVRQGVLEDLMRVDGRRTLPAAIGAARGIKQRLSPRRWRAGRGRSK